MFAGFGGLDNWLVNLSFGAQAKFRRPLWADLAPDRFVCKVCMFLKLLKYCQSSTRMHLKYVEALLRLEQERQLELWWKCCCLVQRRRCSQCMQCGQCRQCCSQCNQCRQRGQCRQCLQCRQRIQCKPCRQRGQCRQCRQCRQCIQCKQRNQCKECSPAYRIWAKLL